MSCKIKGGVRTGTILVCLNCYNKAPRTGWLINNKNLFLAVLEAGSRVHGTSMVRGGSPLSLRLHIVFIGGGRG